jgi:NADH-dependent peroxiredoxin subunit F
MYDLIIVGAGPAGLTAAIYAIRKRMNCLLISPDLGGKANLRMVIEGGTTYQVINGADIVRRFRGELEYLEFARLMEKVTHLEKAGEHFSLTTDSGRQFESKAVILATGADPIRLKAAGADTYFMRGVAYSTVSYAPLYMDKQVALVGSNAMALRGASELAQIASKVHLVAPDRGELDSNLGRRLLASNRVTLYEGWQPVSVSGDTEVRQFVISSPAGEQCTLEVDAVFVELGLVPRTGLVEGWVDLDDQGRIVTGGGTETSVPGLFAAGDITHLPAEQVLIAIGEGAKAALNAYEYLLNG